MRTPSRSARRGCNHRMKTIVDERSGMLTCISGGGCILTVFGLLLAIDELGEG